MVRLSSRDEADLNKAIQRAIERDYYKLDKADKAAIYESVLNRVRRLPVPPFTCTRVGPPPQATRARR